MQLNEGLWPAPMKLNLFLRIVGRTPRNYHEIQSIFRVLDYCDDLEIAVTQSGALDFGCSDPSIPDHDNLALLAAKLLQKRCHVRAGARIFVHKKVPPGSGLGAGSSNAATVLRVLNVLWRCGCTPGFLESLGHELGGDVPFFVRGVDAWVEGEGERLVPISLPPAYYTVFIPKVSVSTKAMYEEPDLTRDCSPITEKLFREGNTQNVFEPLVRKKYPVIRRILDWLKGFSEAHLSGTGAAIFASFPTRDEAQRVWKLRPVGLPGFVAKGCGRSPLLSCLGVASPPLAVC